VTAQIPPDALTWRARWARHRLRALMAATVLLLALALWNPSLPGRRAVQELIIVLDVTQSMAATDQWLPDARGAQHASTRLQFAKAMLSRALEDLPCGTRVGWGVFTEHRTFVLMAPVEVCSAYSELRASLAAIDFRMAWTGNSEVAKGLDSALRLLHGMKAHPALVFVTDGHEAPPVHPQFRPGFHVDRGAIKGVLLGVGGEALVPIPMIDPQGKVVGQWAAKDVMQVDSRTAARNASPGDHAEEGWSGSGTMTGATPGREHFTSLREDYLHVLAEETGLQYLRLRDARHLAEALVRPELSRTEQSDVPLRLPLAGAALLLLVSLYRPVQTLRLAWQRHRARRAQAGSGSSVPARPGVSRGSAPVTGRT
jgi:mxaL protein